VVVDSIIGNNINILCVEKEEVRDNNHSVDGSLQQRKNGGRR
jgi:hypothetical protein